MKGIVNLTGFTQVFGNFSSQLEIMLLNNNNKIGKISEL